jgi:hypothetical protein
MGYVVFEDLRTKDHIAGPDDASVKVHRDGCHYYLERKPQQQITIKHEGNPRPNFQEKCPRNLDADSLKSASKAPLMYGI